MPQPSFKEELQDDVPMMKTWLSLAHEEIKRLQLPPELGKVLMVFGGDTHAPGPVNLDPLDNGNDDATNDRNNHTNDCTGNDIPTLIATQLVDEIDADQAQMFARRFVSVADLLVAHDTPTSALLRLGLHRRARQILCIDPPPRALRIRALVDFIWSQALVLANQEEQQQNNRESTQQYPTLLQQLDQNPLVYDEFLPGLRHATIEGITTSDVGPVHINVLRIAAGTVDMHAVDARHAGSTDLASLAAQHGAVAAISGGFFLYSEPDITPPCQRTDPVGLLVTDGRVVGPPALRRAALVQTTETGDFDIDVVGMQGVTLCITSTKDASQSLTLTVDESQGIQWINRASCDSVSIKADQVGISIVGTQVVTIRSSGETSQSSVLPVPLAGFVLVVPQTLMSIDPNIFQTGDVIEYTLPRPFRAAMAGGPILHFSAEDGDDSENGEKKKNFSVLDLAAEDFCGSAPPITFSQDETFDQNLLPRMGAGLTADGELVLVAVDGRNLDQALGLTLRGTAELLERLGCAVALNLDGGSSKRMWIRDKGVVCLSTTEIKAAAANNGNATEQLRPVHSAILFLPKSR